MTPTDKHIGQLVTSLVPLLSRSLAEQFNVFRVLRHGSHEKQLSNLFAWLLDAEGTHGLNDAFQRVFMQRVNASLGEHTPFSLSCYQVKQEVDTSLGSPTGKDIADIVLSTPTESIVIENFEISSGHGHDYWGYLSYGAEGGRRSIVVLLCIRYDPAMQTGGWENAIVLTYADLLRDLSEYVDSDKAWRTSHPRQDFLLLELVEHFVDGPHTVSTEDRIAFMAAMCTTGESARYSSRPQAAAAQEFAELVALHAKQQFEDGRRILASIKVALRKYADHSIRPDVNEIMHREVISSVQARYSGTWEWYVRLLGTEEEEVAALVFGPTAAAYNQIVHRPLEAPDFRKVFILVPGNEEHDVDQLQQSQVKIEEVLSGLSTEDARLAESVTTAIRSVR